MAEHTLDKREVLGSSPSLPTILKNMNNDLTFHKETYEGLTIRLVSDPEPEDPRKWDNLGTMVCSHRNYSLGDKKPNGSLDEELYDLADIDPNEDVQDLRNIKETKLKQNFVILPLYLYDHSGITMSTGSFSDRWDSGQVGFIYCSLEKAQKEFDCDRTLGWNSFGPEQTTSLKDKVTKILEAEVEVYDCYLTGDVCGWILENEDGEEINSVWGYYPDLTGEYKDRWKYPLSETKQEADYYVKNYDYAGL